MNQRTENSNGGYKYPYKLYAFLTILEFWKNDEQIKIDQTFINTYKNHLENDPLFPEIPEQIKTKLKNDYGLMKNPFGESYTARGKGKTKRSSNDFFTICRETKPVTIKINTKYNDGLKQYLINFTGEFFCKNNNDQNIISNTPPDIVSPVKIAQYRIYQSRWALIIKKQANNRCLICDIKLIKCLEAAHIKPYFECADNEKYNSWNGLCLCANHHRLFDGYLALKKNNNEYVFYIKKDIENSDDKKELKNSLEIFNKKINDLCNNEKRYIPFFDYLHIKYNNH
jgi:hypothetical protein